MSSKLLTRIAPTPSGWLHLGNIANFLLIEKISQKVGSDILLRIDDCDGTRTRPEFVEHIFLVLDFLKIKYQKGPRNFADFEKNFSQSNRKNFYFNELKKIESRTFVCECSRKEIRDGIYPGTCKNKGLVFESLKHSIRFETEDQKFGDIVLWRKDDGPSYQLCSVIDDLNYNVNLIIRGEDLKDSTEIQKILAKAFRPEGFDSVHFFHHPLIVGVDGEKLSKTKMSESVFNLMNKGITADQIRSDIDRLIEPWIKSFHI